MIVIRAVILPLLSLFIGCESGTATLGGAFFEKYCIELGEGEIAMTMTDFNQDGHLDLAVVNEDANELTLFMGDGTGALQKAHTLAAGENPSSISAADINGDAAIDLIIANHETSYITLMIGDGKGAFNPAPNSPLHIHVDPHPHVAHAADVDQDGDIDIVIDARGEEGLRIVEGNGDGSFDLPGYIVAVGGDPYLGFAFGDINDDGQIDFVTPNPRDVAVTLSSGGTEWEQPIVLSSSSPFAVGLIDMNGDNTLDIIAASNDGNNPIQVYLADDKGTYTEAPASPFSMAGGAKQIAVGDMNGDDVGDALVSNWNGDALIVFGGTASIQPENIEATDTPWSLAVGDLNGDDVDDFIIGDGETSMASLFLSQGN